MSLGDQHSTAGSHRPREERKGARTIAGRLLTAASLFLLSGGCASVTNSKIAFSEESMHGDDDVVVYLYRERDSVGSSDTWSVRIDEDPIGELKQDAYMAIHVAPGFHAIKAPGNGFMSVWLAGVTSTTDGTKADRVYFPGELLQGKAGVATPDGFKVGDMTYYAAPSRTYLLQSEAGEVRFRDSYYGGQHEGLQVDFNAKSNQPLYIRCRGGEIAFLTKGEAMKGLAKMKYDMPKAPQ
ncbi:MAG: hypothetical protein ABSF35_23700 [Polyangia bacterium]|jgi:hypothetical protein